MIGYAVRYAFSLGLHVRMDEPVLKPLDRELRIRVWWALYFVERQVGEMIGRPSSIAEEAWSTRKPLPCDLDILSGPDAEQIWHSSALTKSEGGSPIEAGKSMERPITWPRASAGVYLRLRIDLASITHLALTKLYAAGTMIKSWEHVQEDIRFVLKLMKEWLDKLPPEYDFFSDKKNIGFGDEHGRYRFILASFYFSCRIITTRPAICRLDSKIENQTAASKSFNNEALRSCVEAAMSQVELLQGEPDAFLLHRLSAWWSQSHLLVQAASIFLLELSNKSMGMEESVEAIWASLIKLLKWLYKIGEIEKSGRKAYNIVLGLAQKAAALYERNLSELRPPFAIIQQGSMSSTQFSTMQDPNWMGYEGYTFNNQGWVPSTIPFVEENMGMPLGLESTDFASLAPPLNDHLDFQQFVSGTAFPIPQALTAPEDVDRYLGFGVVGHRQERPRQEGQEGER